MCDRCVCVCVCVYARRRLSGDALEINTCKLEPHRTLEPGSNLQITLSALTDLGQPCMYHTRLFRGRRKRVWGGIGGGKMRGLCACVRVCDTLKSSVEKSSTQCSIGHTLSVEDWLPYTSVDNSQHLMLHFQATPSVAKMQH
jgi:hypothetical protein